MSVELLLALGGAVATMIAGFWAVATIAGRQFEKRMEEKFKGLNAAIEELRTLGGARLLKVETKCEQLDQEIRRLLIELPRDYVARTDYIRRETVLEAKMDQLGLRIENWILRGKSS